VGPVASALTGAPGGRGLDRPSDAPSPGNFPDGMTES